MVASAFPNPCKNVPTKYIIHRTGSGFKVNVENLKSFALNLGPHTTAPFAAVGVSIGDAPFFTFNASEGVNNIPLDTVQSPTSIHVAPTGTLVRINVEGSVSNRINLESITLNAVWSPVLRRL